MKALFQRIRFEIYLSAILTIALGVVLLIWPSTVTTVICQVLGAMMAVMGAVWIFGYFVDKKGILYISGGLLFLLLGIWIFLRPGTIISLVSMIIGVIMLVHSIKDFQMAAETKRSGGNRWIVLFMLALLGCVFGVVCICDSFRLVKVALQLLGAFLIYDGLTDMVIAFHTVRAIKGAESKLEPIDTEWKEE